jgi:homocysteine S-methyltransferase
MERLRQGPVLADGAMGTLLYSHGVSFDHCFEALNETDPELVCEVHRAYLAAGAELIETNTFGANALRLAEHGLENRVTAFNTAAARLARHEADRAGGKWVAGSVGPLGVPLAPMGALPISRARALFGEQIAGLVEGGVDLIAIETMRYLSEALAALEACREACDLPVMVLVTFGEDGLTATGRRPEEVARALEDAGADILGTNCSTGPQMALDVVARMRGVTDRPLCAMPNAGLPAVAGGRYIYSASPRYTAEVAAEMAAVGVTVLGGCCGTTPDHVAAMRDALSGTESRPPRITLPVLETSGSAKGVASLRGPTGLERALAERFVVTVEVDPPRGFSLSGLMPQLRRLRDDGVVDAVDVADNPRAQARMSALVLCALVQSQLGMETVLHVGCRHRNLVAVHSDLMGAHALGVRNLFVVMGDLPANGDYPDATVNNDLTASGLIGLVGSFNGGVGIAGQPLEEATAFHVGCAFDFGARDMDRELRVLDRKLEGGARYALTQPVYDPRPVEAVLSRMGGRFPIPLLLGILPLWNERHALFLHHEVPGIHVPPEVLRRMEGTVEAGSEEGTAVAIETLTALGGAVNGAYFMPPFGRFELVTPIVEAVRDRVGAPPH